MWKFIWLNIIDQLKSKRKILSKNLLIHWGKIFHDIRFICFNFYYRGYNNQYIYIPISNQYDADLIKFVIKKKKTYLNLKLKGDAHESFFFMKIKVTKAVFGTCAREFKRQRHGVGFYHRWNNCSVLDTVRSGICYANYNNNLLQMRMSLIAEWLER